MKKEIQIPVALKQLILSNNELLRGYQEMLTVQVQNANIEMMQLLGLDPVAGWRLDIENMKYVQIDTSVEVESGEGTTPK